MIRGKLRVAENGRVAFYCEGCKTYHYVNVGNGDGPRWSFNGDYDKPTFSPSILVTGGHYISGHKGRCWCDYNKENPDKPASLGCFKCHSFVTDGKVQYLDDCTHELAGKTIELNNIV